MVYAEIHDSATSGFFSDSALANHSLFHVSTGKKVICRMFAKGKNNICMLFH